MPLDVASPGWRTRSPTFLRVRPIDLDRAAASVNATRADTIAWALFERDTTLCWVSRGGAVLPASQPLQIDVIRENRRVAIRIPLTDARELLDEPMNLAAWVEGDAYAEVRHRLLADRR